MWNVHYSRTRHKRGKVEILIKIRLVNGVGGGTLGGKEAQGERG